MSDETAVDTRVQQLTEALRELQDDVLKWLAYEQRQPHDPNRPLVEVALMKARAVLAEVDASPKEATPAISEETRALLWQAREALRHTREYVGEKTLPAVEGWSWYDATVAIDAALGYVQPAPATPAKSEGTTSASQEPAAVSGEPGDA